ncbi:hypothetical protein K0016_16945 [Escherichia coli]|nr:hypothetical protein [Escherichia coli]QYI30554.1 hypothetical protein K0016_16945 [Escherichia coli]
MIRRDKRRIRHCAPTAGCGVNALYGLRFAIREGGRTVGAGVVAKVLG